MTAELSVILSAISVAIAVYTFYRTNLSKGKVIVSEPAYVGATSMPLGDSIFMGLTITNSGASAKTVKLMLLVNEAYGFLHRYTFRELGVNPDRNFGFDPKIVVADVVTIPGRSSLAFIPIFSFHKEVFSKFGNAPLICDLYIKYENTGWKKCYRVNYKDFYQAIPRTKTGITVFYSGLTVHRKFVTSARVDSHLEKMY